MPIRRFCLPLLLALLGWGAVHAAEGVNVQYPAWFKDSLHDLQGDLQDAADAGKDGILVFFSTKTCSYCNAMTQTTFKEPDIVRRLRARYDVIALEVLSDLEVVDPQGETHWAKDFAVREKAQFTPSMIFYGLDGSRQLRMVGYQSPAKFRRALDYLEGGHYRTTTLGRYLRQDKPTPTAARTTGARLDLTPPEGNDQPLLVVFEADGCAKCRQLRAMLKSPVLAPYAGKVRITHVSSSDALTTVITPLGKQLSGNQWANELGLIHRPAMLFFDADGAEVVRVDTDILIDQHGNDVADDDADILGNIERRFIYVLSKGYESQPQYQRWNAEQARKAR